jgi:hypothetical protein
MRKKHTEQRITGSLGFNNPIILEELRKPEETQLAENASFMKRLKARENKAASVGNLLQRSRTPSPISSIRPPKPT